MPDLSFQCSGPTSDQLAGPRLRVDHGLVPIYQARNIEQLIEYTENALL